MLPSIFYSILGNNCNQGNWAYVNKCNQGNWTYGLLAFKQDYYDVNNRASAFKQTIITDYYERTHFYVTLVTTL